MTLTLFFIALSLAMDAFAVSISFGLAAWRPSWLTSWRISLSFGFFQAFMPLLGWLLGRVFGAYIVRIDHWIAFLLLTWVGGKMIRDGLRLEKSVSQALPANLPWSQLLALSFATSIDALAIGVSLALTHANIWVSACAIGLVTTFLCLLGVRLGRFCGAFLRNHATVIGGVVLVGIGVKTLVEHLFFGA